MSKSKNHNNYEKCRQQVAKQYNERLRALEEENSRLFVDNIKLKEKLKSTEEELEQIKTDLKLLGLGDKTIVKNIHLSEIPKTLEIGQVLSKYSDILGNLTF